MHEIERVPYGTWDVLRKGQDVAILAVGTMVLASLAAADLLARDGLNVTVVNCRYLKPYDEVTLAAVLAQHERVLTVEEGTIVNGFGAYMSAIIERHDESIRVQTLGVPDRIMVAAARKRQLQSCGLTPEGIADRVRASLESGAIAG